MTDRLFAEIEDPRERACVEALWNSMEPWSNVSPETIAAHRGSGEARDAVRRTLLDARPFLAMYDAVQRFESGPPASVPAQWPPMSTDWDEARRRGEVLVRLWEAPAFVGKFNVVVAREDGSWSTASGSVKFFAGDHFVAGWWPLPECC